MRSDTLTRAWSPDQHQLVELEIQAAYARGFEAGRVDRQADIEEWVQDFAASAPGAVAHPVGEAAVQVVRDLVSRMLAESRPSAAPPPGNHPGGPVPTWGGDE